MVTIKIVKFYGINYCFFICYQYVMQSEYRNIFYIFLPLINEYEYINLSENSIIYFSYKIILILPFYFMT